MTTKILPSHSEPNVFKRKPPKKLTKKPKMLAEWYRVDELVDKVYCELCNGNSRSKVINNLMVGVYGNKELSYTQAERYYYTALARIKFDKAEKEEDLRELLYSRYETLFEEAISMGDRFTAKSVLDSMAKIFLTQQPHTQVQVNNQGDGKVEVKFGFSSDDLETSEI